MKKKYIWKRFYKVADQPLIINEPHIDFIKIFGWTPTQYEITGYTNIILENFQLYETPSGVYTDYLSSLLPEGSGWAWFPVLL
jgi:hypothetical protein